jgi:DNA-directed RNA polymerase subunit RPC12/RpoP
MSPPNKKRPLPDQGQTVSLRKSVPKSRKRAKYLYPQMRKKEKPSPKGFIKLSRSVLRHLGHDDFNLARFGAYVSFLLSSQWQEFEPTERHALSPTKMSKYTGMDKGTWSRHHHHLMKLGLLENEQGFIPYFYDEEDKAPEKLQRGSAVLQQNSDSLQQSIAETQPVKSIDDSFSVFSFAPSQPIIEGTVAEVQQQNAGVDTYIDTTKRNITKQTVDLPEPANQLGSKCIKCGKSVEGMKKTWSIAKYRKILCDNCKGGAAYHK